MTGTAFATKPITLEEYFEMEYSASERHEFVNGKTRTMPYTSENHQHLVAELMRLLGNKLIEINSNLEVFGSDKLLLSEYCNRVYYPDLTVFPKEVQYQEYRGKMMAALNPSVVIEVLSDSTEAIDRGEKFHCYKKIESLRQYVLISQHSMRVEIFEPVAGSGNWVIREFAAPDDKLTLAGCELSLNSIYRRVAFTP